MLRADSGPLSSVDRVQAEYAAIQSQFPNYTVQPSTFERFLAEVDAAYSAGLISLPEVTQEIGDTWSYGFGSDPRKSGEWRLLQQLHADCIADIQCDSVSPQFMNFTRLLLKGGEHTWSARWHTARCTQPASRAHLSVVSSLSPLCCRGGDHKTYLNAGSPTGDYYAWNNSEYAAMQGHADYQNLLYTWTEQRDWSVNFPLQALPSTHPIVSKAQQRFAVLRPDAPPSLDGYDEGGTGWYTVGNLSLHVGLEGAVDAVMLGNVSIASVDAPLTSVVYQLFDNSSYVSFLSQYANCDIQTECSWAFYDYGQQQRGRVPHTALPPAARTHCCLRRCLPLSLCAAQARSGWRRTAAWAW